MEHLFSFDGNSKKIAWMIQTNNSTVKQFRNHPDIYLDKVTDKQARYISLHVGLFWGIGRFVIKNEDTVKIKIHDNNMFNQLFKNENSSDEFIKTRLHFISKLIKQRKLKVEYELIDEENNLLSIQN